MRKIKTLILMLFVAGTVSAQTTPTTTPSPTPSSSSNTQQSFRFGLDIAPILSWAKAKDNSITTSGTKIGFAYGLMADFYFAKNYAINTGVSITYISADVTYDSANVFPAIANVTYPKNTTVEYKLQYVEIPLDLKLKTDMVGYLSYYGQFGGMIGVNIGSKGNFTTPDGTLNASGVKMSSGVNAVNLGLYIGAGFEYNIVSHTSIIAGLNYVNNFTNFTGKPANAAINHIDLTIGVFF